MFDAHIEHPLYKLVFSFPFHPFQLLTHKVFLFVIQYTGILAKFIDASGKVISNNPVWMIQEKLNAQNVILIIS